MIHINRYLFCKVLAESEQMRKEADDVGPKAELDHWKKRMAKFNSLLDQIKGAECKAVVGVLHAAKSKLLKVCFAFYSVQKRGVDGGGLYRVILVLLRSKP